MKKDINTIVFGVNWFGDTLMSLPFYQILKKQSPNNTVTAIIHKRVEGLFKNNSNIDHLHSVDQKLKFSYLLKLLPIIKAANADTAYLLRPSNSQVLICRLAGIKNIICHNTKMTKLLGAQTVEFPQNTHRMDVYLSLLDAAIKDEDKVMELSLSKEELQFGKDLYERLKHNNKAMVVIHPMANWDLKRWPLKSFAKLADQLINRHNISIIITGTQDDQKLSAEIKAHMDNTVYDLCGKLNIRELSAFLKFVDLFVSADTGIMHLAAAVGTPVIGLFGPTDEHQTCPRGKSRIDLMRYNDLDCSLPCYKLDCEYNKCMHMISVNEVFNMVTEVLNEK